MLKYTLNLWLWGYSQFIVADGVGNHTEALWFTREVQWINLLWTELSKISTSLKDTDKPKAFTRSLTIIYPENNESSKFQMDEIDKWKEEARKGDILFIFNPSIQCWHAYLLKNNQELEQKTIDSTTTLGKELAKINGENIKSQYETVKSLLQTNTLFENNMQNGLLEFLKEKFKLFYDMSQLPKEMWEKISGEISEESAIALQQKALQLLEELDQFSLKKAQLAFGDFNLLKNYNPILKSQTSFFKSAKTVEDQFQKALVLYKNSQTNINHPKAVIDLLNELIPELLENPQYKKVLIQCYLLRVLTYQKLLMSANDVNVYYKMITKDADAVLKLDPYCRDACYLKADYLLKSKDVNFNEIKNAIDDFYRQFPADKRSGELQLRCQIQAFLQNGELNSAKEALQNFSKKNNEVDETFIQQCRNMIEQCENELTNTTTEGMIKQI